jgi:hypothetical protein
MPMLFPHDPRRAEPFMSVPRGVLKNSYPHHNPPLLWWAALALAWLCGGLAVWAWAARARGVLRLIARARARELLCCGAIGQAWR